MYILWKEKRITKPSDYWNMSSGDKLMTRLFYQKYMEEKNKERKELKNNIFPVAIV